MRRNIDLKIKKHNNFVNKKIKEAENGKIINLTDLIKQRESFFKK